MCNPRDFPRKRLIRKRRNTELHSRSFGHTGCVLFRDGDQEPQTRSLFHPHHRNSNAGTAGRPDERPWMDVSLRHHTLERRSHLQIPFNIANRFQCRSRSLGASNDRFEPCTVCLDCFLRNLQIIPGNNTRSCGSRFQSLVGAFVRSEFCFCLPTLRLCALEFRLRLRTLGRNFRSHKARHKLSRFHTRSAIHADRIHEGGNFGIDGDDFIRLQFSRQAHGDGKLPGDDLGNFHRGSGRRSPLRVCCAGGGARFRTTRTAETKAAG